MLFTPTTCIQIAQRQSSSVLGNETIVLNYDLGNCYELNEITGFVLSLLQTTQTMSVGEIKEQLLGEFDVADLVCQNDLMLFLPDIRLHIGVRKNGPDRFSAHAWLTYQEKAILGDQVGQVFEPILVWSFCQKRLSCHQR